MSDRSSIMHSLPPQRKDNLRDGAAVSMAIRLRGGGRDSTVMRGTKDLSFFSVWGFKVLRCFL